jgi:hypothetical protein
MSRPPDRTVHLSKTLILCEFEDCKHGNFGFWLYDKTRGMNLSMKAKTERQAFVEALTYYQKQTAECEKALHDITEKVESFVELFTPPEEEV